MFFSGIHFPRVPQKAKSVFVATRENEKSGSELHMKNVPSRSAFKRRIAEED
jgi:hypothetical protein